MCSVKDIMFTFKTVSFLTTLLDVLGVAVSSQCPSNFTVVQLSCTQPVQTKYDVIVEQIVAGNDSGVPDLCRMYENMTDCLHKNLNHCGRRGQEVIKEGELMFKDTLRIYCQYHREENPAQETFTKPHTNANTASSLHSALETFCAGLFIYAVTSFLSLLTSRCVSVSPWTNDRLVL